MDTTNDLFFIEEQDLIDLQDYWEDDIDYIFEQEQEFDDVLYEDLPQNLDALNFGPQDEYADIPFDDNNKLLSFHDLRIFLSGRDNSLNTLYLNKFHLRNPKTWRKILYILNVELSIDDILDIPDAWIAFLQIFKNRYQIGYLTKDEVDYLIYKLRPLWEYVDDNVYINKLYIFLRYVQELYQDQSFEDVMYRRRSYIDDWNRQRFIDINERNMLVDELMESEIDRDDILSFPQYNPNLLYESDEDYYSEED